MRKLVLLATMLLLTSSCIGGGGDERTILVDFSHDEFASFMIANFPREVTVTPGDKIVFKQIWTGEPHTVTGGKMVDAMYEENGHWIEFFEAFDALMASGADLPDPENPGDAQGSDMFDAAREAKDKEAGARFITSWNAVVEAGEDVPSIEESEDMSFADLAEQVDKISAGVFENETLPWGIDETKDGEAFVTQNAGQPCFITDGGPPKDAEEPCAEEDQDQPAFDGTATYYNSGIIPYEGPQGNTFEVQLSEDIEPGAYNFYCAVHGPSQRTRVNIAEEGARVPPQDTVNREARKEIATFASPMLDAFRDAQDGTLRVFGEEYEGPFAGLLSPAHGSINEFVPRKIETRVGEPVTWTMMGADHTITFDPPEYFPIIRFAPDGEITMNPKLQAPAGGSPPIPKREPGPPGTGEPIELDGGTWDGDGFFSSGLFGGDPYSKYTLRFSQPGTYKYACLLHPPMVGTVEVN
jgi:plastocyanin